MQINLNVKINGGPRTKATVEVYTTSVNQKVLKLRSGTVISEIAIAKWIKTYLTQFLTGVEVGDKATDF